VNQRNLCALVIMPLFMLLTIFQNHYLGNLSFIQIILFVENKSQDLSLKTKLLPKLRIFKTLGTYKVV
jgi:hypothetical protein